MSDEKQPDLPGIPTSPSGDGNPIHGVENLMNAPPLDWDEPVQPGTVRPMEAVPASSLKADALDREHQTKTARKSSSRKAQETPLKEADNGTAQPGTMSKPIRKRAASIKDALTPGQAPFLAANEPAPTLTGLKPVRRSRRAATKTAMAEEVPQIRVAQNSSAREDVPLITKEAIEFLRNPDAKAVDIARLGADSRAFVEYHITNLQRIEAHGEITRRALKATAPKFSPQFETVAYALLAGRTKRNTIGALEAAEPGAAAPVEKANADYGPKRTGIYVPGPITVQIGTMEIVAGTGASRLEIVAMKTTGATTSGRFMNAKAIKDQTENLIERGVSHERLERSALAKAEKLRPTSEHAPLTNRSAHSFGRQVLHTMGGIAQTAGVWLQSKADGASFPAPSSVSQSAPKRTAGNSQPSTENISTPIPETVRRRFLKVEQNYYFPDKTHAFSDHGNRLATRGTHPEVVRSLVEIAKTRGWESITVKGSDEFRRSAWMEAAASGLQVAGYKPTELDLAELAQRPSRNAVEAALATEHTKPIMPTGSKAVPEPVQATAVRSRTPTATSRDKNREPGPELVAKARSFENDKPVFAVKKHPDLAPGYGIVDAAKKFAEANLPETAREQFIGLARRHVIQKIIAGENVKGPQIYSTPQKAKDDPIKDKGPGAQSPEEGKPPRTKEVARER